MQVTIGNRHIGDKHPVYIVAEIGSNHNQRFEMAVELIEKAKEAGADAAKFQIFKAEHDYSIRTPRLSSYDSDIYELIKSLELNRDWLLPLKEHCDGIGIDFLSSPCDLEAVDQLAELETGALKVASFDLTDVVLIRYMAKTGLAVFLSTGLATMAEIETAVNICRQEKNNDIVLLQCTSVYPAPPRLSNLRAMQTMKMAFNCVVGYSDHTFGDHVALSAIAMGAKVIEKHFTLDRTLDGPDHGFAIEPHELEEMVRKIRDIENAFGDGMKNGPRYEEKENFQLRRSIILKRSLKKGHVLNREDLIVKRPGFGIKPEFINLVVGRILKRDAEYDEWLTWDMI